MTFNGGDQTSGSHEAKVRAACRLLEAAASKSDPDKIRAAYARWDALETGRARRA